MNDINKVQEIVDLFENMGQHVYSDFKKFLKYYVRPENIDKIINVLKTSTNFIEADSRIDRENLLLSGLFDKNMFILTNFVYFVRTPHCGFSSVTNLEATIYSVESFVSYNMDYLVGNDKQNSDCVTFINCLTALTSLYRFYDKASIAMRNNQTIDAFNKFLKSTTGNEKASISSVLSFYKERKYRGSITRSTAAKMVGVIDKASRLVAILKFFKNKIELITIDGDQLKSHAIIIPEFCAKVSKPDIVVAMSEFLLTYNGIIPYVTQIHTRRQIVSDVEYFNNIRSFSDLLCMAHKIYV